MTTTGSGIILGDPVPWFGAPEAINGKIVRAEFHYSGGRPDRLFADDAATRRAGRTAKPPRRSHFRVTAANIPDNIVRLRLPRGAAHQQKGDAAMDLGMTGKTALVTGGSAGIGKAITRVLAREGVDVAICARRKEPLEQTAAEIARQTNRKIVPIVADLTKPEDAENFVKQAHAALGRIDILVNNAGSSPGGVLDHLSEADWAQSLQLKFMGYVRCLKHVLPIMQKQKKGRVVNLIGNDGVKYSYWEIAPGAANAAGQNLTKSLCSQYGKDNISFVAVNPGPVRTERWTGLVKAMARDMKLSYEEADQLAPKSIPLGRIAEVDEVANLVAYLASDLAFFVNGTMIEIDGGQDKVLMDRMRDR
ncbi:MAG TPA: SDR family NAD(P)-dependent oxidoreductase [Xanthobacteraceae bacterium]|nr:SDR family NAD(P)-dependent oxidoreductase [Xanthobacteraceae bacterium]